MRTTIYTLIEYLQTNTYTIHKHKHKSKDKLAYVCELYLLVGDIEKYCDSVPFVSYFQRSRGTYLLHEAFYLVSNCFFLSD